MPNCKHEILEWHDCDMAGHDNDCYIAECLSCDEIFRDCEEED